MIQYAANLCLKSHIAERPHIAPALELCSMKGHLINKLHDPLQKRARLFRYSRGRLGCVKDAVQALRVHLARDLGADVHQIVHGHACKSKTSLQYHHLNASVSFHVMQHSYSGPVASARAVAASQLGYRLARN